MPLDPIVLQRRLREAGRIRIGVKVPATKRDGTPTTRPGKISTFRFTARDETVIKLAAELYGGEPKPWTDEGPQWEVVTPAKAIEVVLPPPDIAFSQWLELWSGGGCQRRCTGTREVLTDGPCICDTEDRERQCKPHTRLSVMLPDLENVGLWRIDTLGWNAAAEIQGAIELAGMFAARGAYLPARLLVEVREQRTPGEPVRKFAVPVLDLGVSMRRVAALNAANVETAGALEAGPPAAVALPAPEAPSFQPVPDEAQQHEPAPEIADAVKNVGQGPKAERANAAEPLPPTGLTPRTSEAAAPPAGPDDVTEDPEGGDDDAEVVATPTPTSPEQTEAVAPDPPDTAVAEATGAAGADDDPEAKARARNVGMWCRDAGMDDDTRHDFLRAFSKGRYDSAKLVPADDIAAIRAALVRYRRGDLTLESREVDGARQSRLLEPGFGWESTDPGAQHRAGGPAVVTDEDLAPPPAVEETTAGELPQDEADWLARIAEVPGTGKARLLNRARKFANDLKDPQPDTLNDLAPATTAKLDAWLRERENIQR